ncbi:unnamed protein product [Pedinophyceae sp. YPF-701]|nr:unnamed protein product [Pedinophyceae sp. YPF-701]
MHRPALQGRPCAAQVPVGPRRAARAGAVRAAPGEDSARAEQMKKDAQKRRESSSQATATDVDGAKGGGSSHSSVKAISLQATLGTGAVNTTLRTELPSPAVASRNLMEQAKFAQICTVMGEMHHRRAGYPFGTVVDFAVDGAGCPVFCLSPLGIHTRNILEDPRCSLVVQMPGWSGLANASVTLFGDVYQLPRELEDKAADLLAFKMTGKEAQGKWVSGGYLFFRMHHITDVYFVGGFGTQQWVDVAEYERASPDAVVANNLQRTLQSLNQQFGKALNKSLSESERSQPADDAVIISIDRLGADVRVRRGPEFTVERIGFDDHVFTLTDAEQQLRSITADSTSFDQHRLS